jgi:hypothetical protein
MSKRLVYICDWLPPDFGAVGQYAMLEVREWAKRGFAVTLVGLTSEASSRGPAEPVGLGSVEIVRVHRRKYQKQRFVERLIWTMASNLALLRGAFSAMRVADLVLFTGSPPLMLHFIAPLNVVLRRRLIYRIMDFHPECLIAERGSSGLLLGALLRLTYFWRRRVDAFEVLGQDQAQRLREIGIADSRIEIKPNPSPVAFLSGLAPLPLPEQVQGGSGVILYSGNWGLAHDDSTFVEAYARYVALSSNPLRLWINATGVKADRVERELRARGVAFYRSHLVPLEQLARLLIAADVHLVTLREAFVGYVLPSKIHASIESGKRILFIGSQACDVHRLAAASLSGGQYRRVDVGDVEGAVVALKCLEEDVARERRNDVSSIGERKRGSRGEPVIEARPARAHAIR